MNYAVWSLGLTSNFKSQIPFHNLLLASYTVGFAFGNAKTNQTKSFVEKVALELELPVGGFGACSRSAASRISLNRAAFRATFKSARCCLVSSSSWLLLSGSEVPESMSLEPLDLVFFEELQDFVSTFAFAAALPCLTVLRALASLSLSCRTFAEYKNSQCL